MSEREVQIGHFSLLKGNKCTSCKGTVEVTAQGAPNCGRGETIKKKRALRRRVSQGRKGGKHPFSAG